MPLASDAVKKTVVVPILNSEPEGWLRFEPVTAQLSEELGVGKFTTALQSPVGADTVAGSVHETDGAVLSMTFTAKVHVAVFDAASTAVYVTTVTPTLNVEPDA